MAQDGGVQLTSGEYDRPAITCVTDFQRADRYATGTSVLCGHVVKPPGCHLVVYLAAGPRTIERRCVLIRVARQLQWGRIEGTRTLSDCTVLKRRRRENSEGHGLLLVHRRQRLGVRPHRSACVTEAPEPARSQSRAGPLPLCDPAQHPWVCQQAPVRGALEGLPHAPRSASAYLTHRGVHYQMVADPSEFVASTFSNPARKAVPHVDGAA
jgi:hypothetical protein